MSLSREQRGTLVVIAAGAIVLAGTWILVSVFGRALIEGALDGRFMSGLGRSIRLHMTNNPDHASVSFFVDLAKLTVRRSLLLWAVFGLAVVALQRWAGDVLTGFFAATARAETLAVTRFVVFATLAFSVNVGAIEYLSGQPEGTVQAPRFMSWWVHALPLNPAFSGWAARLLVGVSILAAVGLGTRVSAAVAAVLAVYVLGIPQYFGKIDHGMHGLVWISMILAVSPCGEAFSVDRALRRDGPASPAASTAFGLPVRMIWFLFACIYFFPGFWKFAISGWEWAISDNLKFKMYSAWRGKDYLPAFRIDQSDALLQLSALMTVLWEIAFPLLILFRRTRWLALVGGILFHWGVWEFMRIGPPLILLAYVVFVDWGAIRDRLSSPAQRREGTPAHRTTRWVGVPVCALVFLTGMTMTDSWPFGVYPTHAGIRGPTFQTVQMVAVDTAGWESEIDIGLVSPGGSQRTDFAVLASPDTLRRNGYLRGLAENHFASTNDSNASVRFYRAIRWLEPERMAEQPVERELLLEAARPEATPDL